MSAENSDISASAGMPQENRAPVWNDGAVNRVIGFHAFLGVLAGLIPVPVASLLLGIINIYFMYGKINAKAGISFGENITKSIAGMIVGNLAGYFLVMIVCECIEFIPFIGTLPSLIISVIVLYMATKAQGRLYYSWLKFFAGQYAQADGNEKEILNNIAEMKKMSPEERRKKMAEALRKHESERSWKRGAPRKEAQ